MPSRSQFDVAIVGASIAGCTAAIFFGRAGARVALIERDRDPAGYKKLCTHYIQASFIALSVASARRADRSVVLRISSLSR